MYRRRVKSAWKFLYKILILYNESPIYRTSLRSPSDLIYSIKQSIYSTMFDNTVDCIFLAKKWGACNISILIRSFIVIYTFVFYWRAFDLGGMLNWQILPWIGGVFCNFLCILFIATRWIIRSILSVSSGSNWSQLCCNKIGLLATWAQISMHILVAVKCMLCSLSKVNF